MLLLDRQWREESRLWQNSLTSRGTSYLLGADLFGISRFIGPNLSGRYQVDDNQTVAAETKVFTPETWTSQLIQKKPQGAAPRCPAFSCRALWAESLLTPAVRGRRASPRWIQKPPPGWAQVCLPPEEPAPPGPGAYLGFDLEATERENYCFNEILGRLYESRVSKEEDETAAALIVKTIHPRPSCKWIHLSKSNLPLLSTTFVLILHNPPFIPHLSLKTESVLSEL